MLHCFIAEPLMYQCLSWKTPLFQSIAARLPLLLSTRPLHLIHIENERWANATHILTKGRLGLLLQGSDRLEPQARFPSTVNPSLAVELLLLKSPLFMHKCVKEVELSSRDPWLASAVIKKDILESDDCDFSFTATSNKQQQTIAPFLKQHLELWIVQFLFIPHPAAPQGSRPRRWPKHADCLHSSFKPRGICPLLYPHTAPSFAPQ